MMRLVLLALALLLGGCIVVDRRVELHPVPDRATIGLPQASPDGAVGGPALPTGNVYYSQASCSGCDSSHSCDDARTISTPKQSIQAGVDCLAPGDTLYIREGTYPELLIHVSMDGSPANQTVIRGYPGDPRPLVLGSIEFVIGGHTQGWTTLQGVDFELIDAPIDYACVNPYQAHITVEDVECRNAGRNGMNGFSGGTGLPGPDYFILRNSRILNCGRVQPPDINLDTKGGGVYVQGAFMLIENNLIDGCRGGGIIFQYPEMHDSIARNNVIRNTGCASHWGCITTPDMIAGTHARGIVSGPEAHNLQVYNNLIYNIRGSATGDSGCLFFWGAASNRLYYNNTCYNADRDLWNCHAGDIIRNNIFANVDIHDSFCGTPESGTIVDHNLFNPDVSATFVNAPAGDLRLKAGSPAIDAGVAVAGVTMGFSGTAGIAGASNSPGVPRPYPPGGAYDIGAYEYGAVPTTGKPPRADMTAECGDGFEEPALLGEGEARLGGGGGKRPPAPGQALEGHAETLRGLKEGVKLLLARGGGAGERTEGGTELFESRARGRPKTKEYVTFMARVDITLADEVKRYASLHRQPISVVIRDALTLLMEEYPCAADRSGPHQLAAHEFLSDRYESSLDMLLGETESAELEDLLSDTNREVVESMLSDTRGGDGYASDTKEAMTDITSDDNVDRAAVPTRTPARARARKVSDRKRVDDNTSDTKADSSSILSDKKEATATSLPEPLAPAFVSDSTVPTYDTRKHYLGKLCPRRHDYNGTGQSLLRKTNHLCLACDRERAKERRQARHAAARG